MIKSLFSLIFLAFPYICWGGNAVFNPGFDMSPWDSGWTIEIDTVYKYDASGEVEVKADSGRSLPNCCYLRTYCEIDAPGGGGAGEAEAKVMITQNFDDITNCVIKAQVKYYLFSNSYGVGSKCNIEICVNDNWETVWEKSARASGPVFDTVWAEVCTTFVNDTISGVRFYVFSDLYYSCGGGYETYSHFHVDDVYVGKMEVEESEELRVKSLEFRVYPNPFVQFTDVRCQMPDVRIQIYDMAGRLVKETESNVIGKDLLPGVYFVKVQGYESTKIIKMGGVR